MLFSQIVELLSTGTANHKPCICFAVERFNHVSASKIFVYLFVYTYPYTDMRHSNPIHVLMNMHSTFLCLGNLFVFGLALIPTNRLLVWAFWTVFFCFLISDDVVSAPVFSLWFGRVCLCVCVQVHKSVQTCNNTHTRTQINKQTNAHTLDNAKVKKVPNDFGKMRITLTKLQRQTIFSNPTTKRDQTCKKHIFRSLSCGPTVAL